MSAFDTERRMNDRVAGRQIIVIFLVERLLVDRFADCRPAGDRVLHSRRQRVRRGAHRAPLPLGVTNGLAATVQRGIVGSNGSE